MTVARTNRLRWWVPVKIPEMLSFLATREFSGYVPGINDLLNGGFKQADGSLALSAEQKIGKWEKWQ